VLHWKKPLQLPAWAEEKLSVEETAEAGADEAQAELA
jgi:hypothetical protein